MIHRNITYKTDLRSISKTAAVVGGNVINCYIRCSGDPIIADNYCFFYYIFNIINRFIENIRGTHLENIYYHSLFKFYQYLYKNSQMKWAISYAFACNTNNISRVDRAIYSLYMF